jgi:hypothetical protein
MVLLIVVVVEFGGLPANSIDNNKYFYRGFDTADCIEFLIRLLERNSKSLRAEQVEKLAELYNVSLADIISGGVSISFSGDIAKNGYVQNLHEETPNILIEKIITAKDNEIKSLKEEIEYLRGQNKQLLGLVSEV